MTVTAIRWPALSVRSLIPGAFTIAAADLRNSLLPNSVRDQATGLTYQRPPKWR